MKKILFLFIAICLTIIIFGASIAYNDVDASVFVPTGYEKNLPSLDVEDVLGKEETTREPIIPECNETTGWNDAISLSYTKTYAAFSSHNDFDFYTFTAPKTRCVYVLLEDFDNNDPDLPDDATIYIYRATNLSAETSYYNSKAKTYSTFSNNLITVDRNTTIFIKVTSRYYATNYSIRVIENPNLSGVSKYSCDYYYSQGKTTIKYKLDNNMYTIVNGTSTTYAQIFNDAISIWNDVGNLQLVLTTGNDQDLTVNIETVSNLDHQAGADTGHVIGLTDYHMENNGWWFWQTTTFVATRIQIASDFANYTDIESYIASVSSGLNITTGEAHRLFILNATIHELGHSLGIDHYLNENKNIMYEHTTCITTLFDGDIASYLSIWGNL